MLDTADYASLVTEGVSPSMLALVESCYRLLFEATAPAAVATRPIPWDKLAELLKVDISDCVVDGELKPKMVSKKLNTIEWFPKIMDFATKVVEDAIAGTGLSQYPEFIKSPTFMNYKYNLRTTILVNTVQTVAERGHQWLSNENIERHVADELAKRLDVQLTNLLSRRNHFSTTGDNIDRYIPTIPETDDNTLYISRDGVVARVYDRPDTIVLVKDNEPLAYIYVDADDTHKVQTVSQIADNKVAGYRAISDYLANGPVDEYSTTDMNARMMSDDDADSLYTYSNIADLISILRNKRDIYDAIVRSASIPTQNDMKLLHFMVSEYDSGKLDEQSLRSLIQIPEYVERDGIDYQEQRDQVNTMLGDLIGPDEIIEIKKHFRNFPFFLACVGMSSLLNDNTIDCIVGKQGEHRNPITQGEGVRYMYSPAIQANFYRRGIFDLTSALWEDGEEVRGERIYIPIAPEIMRDVFRSANRDPRKMVNVMGYLANSVDAISPNNRGTLFDDVRKWITPRVLREIVDAGLDNDSFYNCIKTFRFRIPGFTAGDNRRRYHVGAYRENNESLTDMTPRQYIRELLKYRDRVISDYSIAAELAIMATSPDILTEVNKTKPESPMGKRIKDLINVVLFSRPLSAIMLHEGIARANEDDIKDLAVFIEQYMSPQISLVRETLAENIADWSHGVLTDGSKMTDFVMYSAMDLYDAGYTELATKLYLEPGGILDGDTLDFQIGLVLMLSIAYEEKLADVWAKFVSVLVTGKNILGNCIEAYHDIALNRIVPRLFNVDKYYRKVTGNQDDVGEVVSDAELAALFAARPSIALFNIVALSGNGRNINALCEKYFTPEYVESLATTEDGVMLLLELSDISGWSKFASSFIEGHRVLINNLLEKMPRDKAESIRKKLFANRDVIARHTGKVSEGALGNISYSAANGLWWMKGYASANDVTKSSAGVTVFNMTQAQQYIDSIRESGWRLPTMSELKNLGTPENIQRLGIGFSPTGKQGKMAPLYRTKCCGWYGDANGNVAGRYVVVDNEIKFIADNDRLFSPDDALAIKLVHSAH